MMKHFLTVRKAKGFLQDSILEFYEEELADYYLCEDMNGESVRYIKIDPLTNVEKGISCIGMPGALFFYPNKQKHPHILLAIHRDDGRPPNLSSWGDVNISVILQDPKPNGYKMCPGCGRTERIKAEIHGWGSIDDNGALQNVDKDDCAIDECSKLYCCDFCRFIGHRAEFSFADFTTIYLQMR